MSDETLTLYHAAPSRGSIVLWMLEEVGAPYRVDLLDLNSGDQKRPEKLAKRYRDTIWVRASRRASSCSMMPR
jgi:hypothetical protein